MTFLLAASLAMTGCSNIFEDASNKNSDEALLEDARKSINDQDYDTALAKFDAMSADFKTGTDIIEMWAGAYAGKCGLDFISYFGSLGTTTMGTNTIFKFLMSAWSQKVISPSHCTLAQQKLEEISANAAERTNSQNLFMAILGMVKIGVYLREYADKDGTGNLGDGTPDAAVNVCTNNSSNLPDAALDEVITGMGLLTNNLAYLTAALAAGDITTALDTLNTACGLSPGTCGKTDPSTITNGDRDSFRDLLSTSQTNATAPVGIGSCTDAGVTPCC